MRRHTPGDGIGSSESSRRRSEMVLAGPSRCGIRIEFQDGAPVR